MTRTHRVARLLAWSFIGSATWAQSPALDADVQRRLDDEVREYFADPELFTRRRQPARPGRVARLLEDVRVELEAFERNDDGDLALGFEYDVAKTLSVSEESDASLDFVADGNVAFDRAQNPNDFLWTSLRARWLGSPLFGREAHEARKQLVEEPPPAVGENEAFEALRRRHLEGLSRSLPPEVVWDFDLHAGLESNQDFSSRQWVFGPAVSARLVSWDSRSKLSRWNVFDFPGAAVRWLAGVDERFRPSGRAYPTVRFGVDMVDASGDDVRDAVTNDSSLLRARLEAGLETHVLDVGDEPLYLTASWCAHEEIDAPSAVRDADYEGSSYFELEMDLPSRWVLTYSAGRLPLDPEEDSTLGLGFEVSF